MSIKPEEKQAYHHGNLRQELVKAGLETLEQEGVSGISLRKLSRDIGVSHNAPYMHFSNKEELLAALAEEGFIELTKELKKSIIEAGETFQDQLREAAICYVQFAVSRPAQMGIMFQHYAHEKNPQLTERIHQSLL